MEEHLIDARGQMCPKPLIMTKKALKESKEGEPIRILIDNETSKDNVLKFLSDNNIETRTTESEGVYTLLLFGASEKKLQKPDAESYCTTCQKPSYVIAIKSKHMGNGSDELGEILMKAFINTIQEMSPLPESVVFYNEGVFLATETSDVVQSLKEIEKMGVKILVCGTCTDYFQIKHQISIGTISNMYSIMETLTNAGHVVTP